MQLCVQHLLTRTCYLAAFSRYYGSKFTCHEYVLYEVRMYLAKFFFNRVTWVCLARGQTFLFFKNFFVLQTFFSLARGQTFFLNFAIFSASRRWPLQLLYYRTTVIIQFFLVPPGAAGQEEENALGPSVTVLQKNTSCRWSQMRASRYCWHRNDEFHQICRSLPSLASICSRT